VLDIAILGQVALGYSPFIDRQRAVIATRLTVFPLRSDVPLDAGQLLHAVGGVWPASGAKVSLNVASESLLTDLLKTQPSANIMVEVPAFMAADPANTEGLLTLHRNGNALLLKGRPLTELPREVLPCFGYSILDLADDRRGGEGAKAPEGVTRRIGSVYSGVASLADMRTAFERGGEAVLGWPIDDAIAAGTHAKPGSRPDMQVITELIHRVNSQEPIDRLELTLKRDPALAFKLLRYINSPAFGLRVEISSFRHAIMMLGYERLKRWLALLLATASKDPDMRPVMFAAVRRGLLMEELVRGSGDEEMRNEMFICGVFSLLDRMFQQPFSELLGTLPVPPRVHQALVEGAGPYQPFIALVRAIENTSLSDFREAADTLMMSVAEINRAQLRALMAAVELD
jgi:EAL and modified HD-GYP domain-containing signal transduction protein